MAFSELFKIIGVGIITLVCYTIIKPVKPEVAVFISIAGSCLILIFVAIMSHGINPYLDAQSKGEFSFPVLFYLIMFVVIMGIGYLYSNDFRNLIKKIKSK